MLNVIPSGDLLRGLKREPPDPGGHQSERERGHGSVAKDRVEEWEFISLKMENPPPFLIMYY